MEAEDSTSTSSDYLFQSLNSNNHELNVDEYIEESSDPKLEDEKDELGPIVDTPFRVRCYTWPRLCLQGHSK